MVDGSLKINFRFIRYNINDNLTCKKLDLSNLGLGETPNQLDNPAISQNVIKTVDMVLSYVWSIIIIL